MCRALAVSPTVLRKLEENERLCVALPNREATSGWETIDLLSESGLYALLGMFLLCGRDLDKPDPAPLRRCRAALPAPAVLQQGSRSGCTTVGSLTHSDETQTIETNEHTDETHYRYEKARCQEEGRHGYTQGTAEDRRHHLRSETADSWRYTITLGNRLRPIVEKLSEAFEMTPREFLHAFYTRTLPGQNQRGESLTALMLSATIQFDCGLPAHCRRIERAAKSSGRTVREFVAGAVGSSLAACEDDMIFHPKTGKPIGDELALCPHGSHPDIDRKFHKLARGAERAWQRRQKERREVWSYSEYEGPDGEIFLLPNGSYEHRQRDVASGEGTCETLDAAGLLAVLIQRCLPEDCWGDFRAFLPGSDVAAKSGKAAK